MDPQESTFLNADINYNFCQKTDILVGLERSIIKFQISLAVFDTKSHAQTLSHLESCWRCGFKAHWCEFEARLLYRCSSLTRQSSTVQKAIKLLWMIHMSFTRRAPWASGLNQKRLRVALRLFKTNRTAFISRPSTKISLWRDGYFCEFPVFISSLWLCVHVRSKKTGVIIKITLQGSY